MHSTIICFGELILRIARSPDWPADSDARLFLGGAEYNVAAALAGWGHPAGLVTALPDNPLGESITAHIENQGIDPRLRRVRDGRMGVYHSQAGLDMKSAGVVYDRKHSAFADLEPDAYDWPALLADAGWFHVSAITPALSENAFDACMQALACARERGVTTSLDLNYRAALWEGNVNPRARIEPMMEYCDWVMGNPWSANRMLGSALKQESIEPGDTQSCIEQAGNTAGDIFARYPDCRYVAQTFRFNRGEGVLYFATLSDREQTSVSAIRQAGSVVNKVGSGDCFMAGLIHGYRENKPPQAIVDFAAAAAFGHFQEETDITRQSLEDVYRVLG